MLRLIIIVSFIAVTAFGQTTFTTPPSMVKSGSNWTIAFAVSQNTDVEISVVKLKDSTVVRHLAAGLLGTNPPPPLAANSLSQTLTWDGKDDFGNAAAQPESLSVRVRAGLSVKLIGFAGEMLKMFPGTARANSGLVLGKNGSVYLQGKVNNNTLIRQYDSSGNYMRTVFPPAATLPMDSVTSYGVNVVPGGGWAPKTTYVFFPSLTTSLLNNANGTLLPIGQPGELIVSDGMNIQSISEGGACTGTNTKLINPTPTAPAGFPSLCGPKYFTASNNPAYLYLSGWYYAACDGGSWLLTACDTGFWADGQVFKVNRATGTVSPWLKINSVPVTRAARQTGIGGEGNATAAIHGVYADGANHVFVCDRVNKRIGVYDTSAQLLGSVPVANPDLVGLSKRTGAVYVATRSDQQGMSLIKFSGWSSPVPVDTVLLTTSVDTWAGTPALVVTENGTVTNIWVGYSFGFRMYRDNGGSLSLAQDFGNSSGLPISVVTMDRLTVDPKTEAVYWGQNYNFKISSWSNPTIAICSTTSQYMFYRSGAKVPSGLDDLTISPKGYLLGYHAQGIEADGYNTPVRRYKADFSTPLPYGNTGINAATCRIYFESERIGNNHRGMAASWQGKIAISMNNNVYTHDNNAIFIFPDTGYAYGENDLSGGTAVVTNLSSWSSGVKFDAAGNLYVGTNIHAADWQPYAGFETDAYSIGTKSGSVVKYAPGTTGAVSGNTATNAAKIYRQPYGTYVGGEWSGCVCRSPRFDVDPYGRLYIPNSADSKVAIADNAGNTIAAFGEYGNTDARGGLAGPGMTYAEPAIPLGWPTGVAASEDYVYIGDYINQRIVRIQKVFELDNIPGLTSHGTAVEKSANWDLLAMTSAPNPFTPASGIRVSMPAAGNLHLCVYNASGRLVREIARGMYGPGVHAFAWRGDGASGQRAAAGLYVYRLTAGNRVLTARTVMAR